MLIFLIFFLWLIVSIVTELYGIISDNLGVVVVIVFVAFIPFLLMIFGNNLSWLWRNTLLCFYWRTQYKMGRVSSEIGTIKGNWEASTAYVLHDTVKDVFNSNIYTCITTHTSSGFLPINSNTDSAKWFLRIDVESKTASQAEAKSISRAEGVIDGSKNELKYGAVIKAAEEMETNKKKLFFYAIIKLSAKMAKVDGQVTPDEIKKLREYFDIDRVGIDGVGNIFNKSVKNKERVEDISEEVYSCLGNNRECLEYIIIGLLQIASADGTFHLLEIKFIIKVSIIFGFTKAEQLSLFAMFGVDSGVYNIEEEESQERNCGSTYTVEQYYRILNCEPGATNNEIKKAYRQLVKKHHPDLLRSKKVPIDEIKNSEDILKIINEAYNYLINQQ